jgi:hypothetical protein
VGWHVGLDKEGGLLRIDSAGNVLRRGFSSGCSERGRVLRDRDGVKIDDTEHRIMSALHLDPLQQGTRVVAKVQ